VTKAEIDAMSDEELRAHLVRRPIRWIPCIGCREKFENQMDGIGGRASFFCSDACAAKRAQLKALPEYDDPPAMEPIAIPGAPAAATNASE